MLVASLIACCAAAPAAPVAGRQAAAITDVQAVTFPAYESYRGIERYAPSPPDYARAVGDRDFVMERLTYRSDGLDVHAYLYRPASPPAGARLPVVVFNRGSCVRGDFSPEVLMPGNRLARQAT